jgi:putative autoinducer-2 (AI-2) aldolase
MAGGKKLPEREALEMAYRAVQEGAAGVDMGRNIFQSHAPAAMLEAVARVVHDGVRPDEAHALFEELARAAEPARVG